MIALFLSGLAVIAAGGVGALAAGRRGTAAGLIATVASLLGGAMALVPAIAVLVGGQTLALRLPWSVPYGSFSIAIDGLSAFFLIPVLALPPLAAVFGCAYMAPHAQRRALGASWFFFNMLVVSMALVVVARNGMLFLVAWETMSLASYFLVTFEDEKGSVREAGWTYLVATHLGTAFLLAYFAIISHGAGSLDFDQFSAGGSVPLLFLLALVGFGTKAGFIPLHVWLPEAHPAAPSHVSAVMSGVMIKMGIYGMLRAITQLGPPQAWWGVVLVGVGVTSGILGVLYALAQHDLKRLLAYCSVENIGIITLGIGVGTLGAAYGMPTVAVLGFAGGLFHVWNHAVFKTLLFLCSGAVVHASGTLEIDRLGGLLKRMPWTGACFLVGAVAISGLPPLNGFASELLIYVGALNGAISKPAMLAVTAIAAIGSLALIGGLAAACFAKAFGIVFLGEPRTAAAADAHESPPPMRFVMVTLSAICGMLALGAPFVVVLLEPTISVLARLEPVQVGMPVEKTMGLGLTVIEVVLGVLVIAAALLLLRRILLAGRDVRQEVTWDCGYARPTARMQYTGSSFARPLTSMFGGFLRTRTKVGTPEGVFPRHSAMESHPTDLFRDGVFAPLFRGGARALARLRWLQHGRLHLYVLYIALTLLALLVWQLGVRQ